MRSILPIIVLGSMHALAVVAGLPVALTTSAQIAGTGLTGTVILQATEVHKLLPSTVFFQGNQLPVQSRNSQGVQFRDGKYLLAALVDSTGHNTALEGSLGYLLTEVPLDLSGHSLKPGVYGMSLDSSGHFVIMDIAADRVFAVKSEHDSILYRPKPLQILFDSRTHRHRLYLERNYVSISRSYDSFE